MTMLMLLSLGLPTPIRIILQHPRSMVFRDMKEPQPSMDHVRDLHFLV